MAIIVPKDGDQLSAGTFGAPVANALNALDANWVSFTPVLAMSGGTPGSGRIAGRYKKIGATTVTFWLTWNWGAGAYGGSGEYRWNLPLPANANMSDYDVIGVGHCAFVANRAIVTMHKVGSTFTCFGPFGQLTSAAPQPVQVNDAYYFNGTYETT